MEKKKLIANLQLVLASAIWGLAFVAQRVGMGSVGPLTFGAARYVLGTLTLYIVLRTMRARGHAMPVSRGSIRAGILCGIFLFMGTTMQQAGLVYTTASKAGFITTLYIVLVPLLGGLFLRRRIGAKVWAGVVLSTIGLYLLSFSGSIQQINIGDVLVFIGAFMWAGHIFTIDHFVHRFEPLVLSMIQFFFTAVVSTIGAILFENISLAAILQAGIPILYSGIFSAGIGFTLQMMGQRHTEPTIASMIMSLEAVFGVLGGYLLLREILTGRELIGCVLIFIAIIFAQLPSRHRRLS